MSDIGDWVVWNGSLGVLDTVALGRIDSGAAWLAEPYDMVGPFNLAQLLGQGQIAFGACLVLSRARWKEIQAALRREALERRRAQAERFARFFDGGAELPEVLDHRAALDLPGEGELTAQQINAAFRRRAKSAHPDAGGDHEAYIRLTQARDSLLERVN